MSKDTSGGVGRPGTAPGTVVQENDAGLVDRGPYPWLHVSRKYVYVQFLLPSWSG
jgi:hypothetical protein